MKARYLGLIGWIALVAAACSQGGGAEPNVLGGELDPVDLRADANDFGGPGSASDDEAALVATPAIDGGTSVFPPACTFPPTGAVHLTLPGARPLASAALARGFIDAGQAPIPSSVRPSDFLNYYPVTYPEKAGSDITVAANIALGDAPSELLLQIAVQAPSTAGPHRKVALVAVVDTSLSMAGPSMARARGAVAALAQALAPGDSLTVVTPTAKGDTIVIGEEGDVSHAVAAAKSLQADGGEHLGAAVADAYITALLKRPSGGIGRVVLITDGAARAGEVDLGIVAGNYQLEGISLIGVGVGDATAYDTSLVDAASRAGGGASVYLDSVEEADRMLLDRFDQLMDVWASDVQVVLALPSHLRLKGVPATSPSDSPTGLSRAPLPLGRTMIFRQVLESCADVSGLVPTDIGVTVRWMRRDATQFTDVEAGGSLSLLGLGGAEFPQITKASILLEYAEALANVRTAQIQAIHDRIVDLQANLQAPLAEDPDLDEIRALTKKFIAAANGD